MRYITCKQCGSIFSEDDGNPNIHYSTPSTICMSCESKNKAPKGAWLQREDGTYYQK